MSDGRKSSGENDRKWRRNCSNWVAAKSGFERFCGGVVSRPTDKRAGRMPALQGNGAAMCAENRRRGAALRWLNFQAVPFAIIECDSGLGAKVGRIAG